MIFRVPRFAGSPMPPQCLIASAHEHSTGAAPWTDVLDEPAQRSQLFASSLADRPHSRLAELPRSIAFR